MLPMQDAIYGKMRRAFGLSCASHRQGEEPWSERSSHAETAKVHAGVAAAFHAVSEAEADRKGPTASTQSVPVAPARPKRCRV